MDHYEREYESRFTDKPERNEDTEFEIRRQRMIDAAAQYEAAVRVELDERRAA